MKKILFTLAAILILSGCSSYERVTYVQNAGTPVSLVSQQKTKIPDVLLKTGDLLTITINSTNPEAAMPFNLPLIPSGVGVKNYNIGSSSLSGSGGSLQNYLVDVEGKIFFPIIGEVYVAGMTKTELSDLLQSRIYPAYLTEKPIVLIRFANFKVSVLGEVSRPGMLNINNERLSIFEAIAQAGDLTIYGRRDNVLLVRENEFGERVSLRLDLRDQRLINSEYYYLQQNDVLYVQPNPQKSRSTFIGVAESMSLSVVSTLISITTLVVTLVRK